MPHAAASIESDDETAPSSWAGPHRIAIRAREAGRDPVARRRRVRARQQRGLRDLPRGVPRRVARRGARARRGRLGFRDRSPRNRLPARAAARGRRRARALPAGADRHLERDDEGGDPRRRRSSRPRASACSSRGTRRPGARGRSPTTSAGASSARASGARAPVQPARARAGRDPEPDRLDGAPDDARPRQPADRRLRRLPRGAGARRRRADRARGDRRAPLGPADLAHARRVPPGDRGRLRARGGRGSPARDEALRPAPARRPRADRVASDDRPRSRPRRSRARASAPSPGR